MAETADILVIGGGIAGVGAAAMLAADARVTVLEAEDAIGRHATGRSAAAFVASYGNAAVRGLNAASRPLFENPGDLTDGPLLSQRGVLMFADETEAEALAAHVAEVEGVEPISPEEAVARVPILRGAAMVAAAWEEDVHDIDVERLLQGYARRLRSKGGRIVQRAGASAIRREGGAWRVETPAGAFSAPILVNAAGAWADRVAAMAGVAPLGLAPLRRSAALLPAPEGHDVRGWPLILAPSETWYARPMGGKLMVSPAEEDPVDAPHDAFADDMVLAEGLDRFSRATGVAVTRVEGSWAGLRTFAPDRTPVAGFAPQAEGFFWLAGQGGYGVQTSPALSRHAADLIHGRPPRLSPTLTAALSPARFSA